MARTLRKGRHACRRHAAVGGGHGGRWRLAEAVAGWLWATVDSGTVTLSETARCMVHHALAARPHCQMWRWKWRFITAHPSPLPRDQGLRRGTPSRPASSQCDAPPH
jgi:hypothetical protein